MTSRDGFWRTPAVVAACIGAMIAVSGPAWAGVVSSTPTLPLLGVPYVASAGAGCFAAAGVCVARGTLTLTAPVMSTFNFSGQDIVTDAVYAATLTSLSSAPLGFVTLTGTVEQEVLGRTTSTQTGSWTVDIVSLLLSGPVLGNTLRLGLDGLNPSSGTTSITPLAPDFLISSFFDVFAKLTLDGTPPLSTVRGPIELTASGSAAIPEPGTLALVGVPLVALWAGRKRHGAEIGSASGS